MMIDFIRMANHLLRSGELNATQQMNWYEKHKENLTQLIWVRSIIYGSKEISVPQNSRSSCRAKIFRSDASCAWIVFRIRKSILSGGLDWIIKKKHLPNLLPPLARSSLRKFVHWKGTYENDHKHTVLVNPQENSGEAKAPAGRIVKRFTLYVTYVQHMLDHVLTEQPIPTSFPETGMGRYEWYIRMIHKKIKLYNTREKNPAGWSPVSQ